MRWGPPIRGEEKRDVAVAAAFLAVFVGSHAILETGRDALFLAEIPASHLPFMMVAIAGLTLVANALSEAFGRLRARRTLSVMALAAGVATAALGLGLPVLAESGLYLLYVWSGVVSTLVLLRFWTMLGELFSVSQAKRLFGLVSTGAVIGAIGGSALATGLAGRVPTDRFVLLGGVGFALAGLLPPLLTRGADHAGPVPAARRAWTNDLVASASFVTRHPYALRVAILTGAASTTLAIADFAFRTTVAHEVPKEDLARLLATLALCLNLASLGLQLASGAVLRRLPLPWVLAILPSFLVGGGAFLLAGGGLFAALLLKGADGSLRYSLHKTASELLHLPLSETERRSAKAFLEVVGNRGGQIVAAAVALAVAQSTHEAKILAGVVVGLSLVWIALSVGLRTHYVETFRAFVLSGRRVAPQGVPDLDLGSLEKLLESLDDESDARVVAALAILESEQKANVVPTLILYHPSEAVVLAALRLFVAARRKVALHAIGHLQDHPSPRVRAEAIAARAVLDPTAVVETQLARADSPEVLAATIATLGASGAMPVDEAVTRLTSIVATGNPSEKIVIAEVIGWRRHLPLEPILIAIAETPEPEVRRAVVGALGAMRTAAAARALVALLGDHAVKVRAREELAAVGQVGRDAVLAALRDTDTPKPVRWNLPQTLAEIDPEAAPRELLGALASEPDGMVRYRMVEALLWVQRRRPQHRLPHAPLEREIQAALSRAYRYLDRQLILQRGAREVPSRRTPGHSMLVDLVLEKRQHTLVRVFRLLALRHPGQPFLDIHRSLGSPDKNARGSAVELLTNLLREPQRTAVVGLVDDADDEARLAAGADHHTPLDVDYEAVIGRLLGSTSRVVRDIAAFHVAELHLVGLRPLLAAMLDTPRETPDVIRSIGLLDARAPGRDEVPSHVE